MEQTIEKSVRKYCLVFAGAYALSMAFINLLNVSLGGGTNIAMLIAAGYAAIFLFVKETGRAPIPSEKKRLIWGSILAAYLVSIAALIVILSVADNETVQAVKVLFAQVSFFMLVGVSLLVTALYYLCLKVVYGYIGNKILQKSNGNSDVLK